MAPSTPKGRLSPSAYVEGVRKGDRSVLSRAITLMESRRPEDRKLAEEVLNALLPETGGAHRIGITGAPGVGKSTLIDRLGSHLIEQGHRLAVLAVDPSSVRSGGSILGDKTRMVRLAGSPAAYVRPSPSGGTLGGVARATREAILLCEAAGFDIIFVETVGVGQSEVMVAEMVDLFLLLLLPGAGDELQGIKKGVLELADVIAVTKADGDNLPRAREAARQIRSALRILEPPSPHWRPPVLLTSARTGAGLQELWQAIERHHATCRRTSAFRRRRRNQQVRWFHALLDARLEELLQEQPGVAELLPELEQAVADGRMTPTTAVERLIARLLESIRGG